MNASNEDEDCKFDRSALGVCGGYRTPEEEAAELEKERQAFMECCGSCLDFAPFYATAGVCRSAEGGCPGRNPKAMKDMFDPKCDRWKYNENS